MLEVTVFHDVMCTWCYVFSKTFNKIKKDYEGLLDIKYIAWPLYIHSFEKSSDRARESILRHWEDTKSGHPDAGDINPAAMADKTFIFPHSIPALTAVKCAELQRGQEGHSEYYDLLQEALYKKGEDINNLNVLKSYAEKMGLDTGRFVSDFESGKQHEAVFSDMEYAKERGINAIPSTIIGHEIVLGAVPEEDLREVIDNQLEAHGFKAA